MSVNRGLLVPFRVHTLVECDEIIRQASGVTRTANKNPDSILIEECTLDWWATKRGRERQEIELDDLIVICGFCASDMVVDPDDNGSILCRGCRRKLIWRKP